MKVLWLFGGVFALIVLAAALPHPDKPPQNPDEMSVGYLPPGVCMSADKFNWAADMVVKNTNWSQIEGSATFSASTKSLVGATTVFREMARLGTPACPDLAPLYSQYLV